MMLTILNLHKSQSVCWDLHRWWIKIFFVSSFASDQRLEALMTKHISTQCDQKYWSKTKTFNNNIKTKQSSSAGHHLNKQDLYHDSGSVPWFLNLFQVLCELWLMSCSFTNIFIYDQARPHHQHWCCACNKMQFKYLSGSHLFLSHHNLDQRL